MQINELPNHATIGSYRDYNRGDYFFARTQSETMRALSWARDNWLTRLAEWVQSWRI